MVSKLLLYAFSVMIFSGVVIAQPPLNALAVDCPDGTAEDNILDCMINPPTPTNTDANIDAGAGADTITVAEGVTLNAVYGDGDPAIAGFAPGDGFNDTITNRGTLVTGIFGDVTFGQGGNDVIINYGMIGDQITGDFTQGDGGDDRITNYGTVNGNISGDVSNTSSLAQRGGDDIIINYGTVNGTIQGEGGDDTIIIGSGANGGGGTLELDGGPGIDTLDFGFPNLDALTQDLIASLEPATGFIQLFGISYQWLGFEFLAINGQVVGTVSIPANLQIDTPVSSAPVAPTFIWTHQNSDTATSVPAAQYWLYMQRSDGMVVFNEILAAVTLCEGVICRWQPTYDDFGLLNGDYQWWVGGLVPGTQTWVWSGGEGFLPSVFTVNVPAPELQASTNTPNQGRPTLLWPGAANAYWYQVFIGSGDGANTYLAWHSRAEVCIEATCTLNPAIDWAAAGNPHQVWMQAWGPGGYGINGTLSQFPAWVRGQDLILPGEVPGPPLSLGVPDGSVANPQFVWTSGAGSTWFELILQPTNDAWVWPVGWFQAAELGCPGADQLCSYISPFLAGGVLPDGEYRVRVRAWGPGGLGDYVEATFSYTGST